MSNIARLINEAEEKWLNELYTFVSGLFKSTFIPSHNHLHHLRTWQNAKIILSHLTKGKCDFNYNQIEEVLIASLFHDTGLTQTLDEKHGKAGAVICQNYFHGKGKFFPALNSVLEAIELHENKSFSVKVASPASLKTIISVADDMDAFGIIGIYRYAEIYFMRGISSDDLGAQVLHNLQSRFKNIEINYLGFPHFLNEVSIIYNQTKSFYENLKDEKPNEMAIINFIKNELVEKRRELNKIVIQNAAFLNNGELAEFFNDLLQMLQNKEHLIASKNYAK